MQRLLKPLWFYAVMLPLAASADFNSAVTAYEQQDYAKAYQEFRRLAELGDTPSQRNLAAMYARGEHVAKDSVEAWAWAALAAEQDTELSAQIRNNLAENLNEAETLLAEKRYQELRQQFGQLAISEKLLPVPADQMADCSVDINSDARPIKISPPRYPEKAARSGVEGHACLTFYLSEAGEPLRSRVSEAHALKGGKKSLDEGSTARYASMFSEEAKNALQKWTFMPPATQALREVPSRYCLDFRLGGSAASKQDKASKEQRMDAAIAGDPAAQYELALGYEAQLNWLKSRSSERDNLRQAVQTLYRESALAGYADSQFKMATNLLTGNQCKKDIGKGIAWLTFAAQQGHGESQYLLASRLRHGEGVEPNPEKATKWLQAAAEGGHSRAQLEYALYLLQHHPDQAVQARRYLPETPKSYDLVELEAAALSQALAGDFALAVKYQTEVVAIAKEINSAYADREQALALALYQANQLPQFAALH